MFIVFNRVTKRIVGKYKTVYKAREIRDKIDNEYGGYCCDVIPPKLS